MFAACPDGDGFNVTFTDTWRRKVTKINRVEVCTKVFAHYDVIAIVAIKTVALSKYPSFYTACVATTPVLHTFVDGAIII